jgi:hypothetical protein
MAGTDDNTTPITLISLAAARDLVVETLLSAPWAEQLIIKWLYQGHVGWQREMVLGQPGPGRTLDQEAEDLWAQPTKVLVDWQQGYACRVTVYRKDKAGCLKPLRRVTVIGIRVVREDIERQLAQMSRVLVRSAAAGNQSKLPKEKPKLQTASVQPKDWLFGEFDRVSCPVGEQAEYLRDIHERINKDKSVRGRPVKLKTIQNRYAEWKELPKRRPK